VFPTGKLLANLPDAHKGWGSLLPCSVDGTNKIVRANFVLIICLICCSQNDLQRYEERHSHLALSLIIPNLRISESQERSKVRPLRPVDTPRTP
jgi:hypothetical protein